MSEWTCPVTTYGAIHAARGPVPSPDPSDYRRVPWAGLCALLGRYEVTPHKALAGAWSPVRLSSPRRAAANVAEIGALVLDVDDGTAVEAAVEAWRAWRHLIHTSHSHTLAHPRYRVVVPLSRAITSAEHRRVWRWASARFPAADPSAKDAARAYYLPAVPSEDSERVTRVHDGPMLDPDACEAPRRRVSARVTPGEQYRPSQADADARALLRSDPAARRAYAAWRGAQIIDRPVGEVARGARCPSCGDASVWWLVQPDRRFSAECHHRRTCGWSGPLWDV